MASEELEIGLTSVSTPIRDRNDTLIAVINVSGPTSRLIHRVDDIAKLLLTASAAIKHSLRSTRPPTPRQASMKPECKPFVSPEIASP